MTFGNEGLTDIYHTMVSFLKGPLLTSQFSKKMGGRKSKAKFMSLEHFLSNFFQNWKKLNKKEVEELVTKTNFTAEEIKTWYNGFLRDC